MPVQRAQGRFGISTSPLSSLVSPSSARITSLLPILTLLTRVDRPEDADRVLVVDRVLDRSDPPSDLSSRSSTISLTLVFGG